MKFRRIGLTRPGGRMLVQNWMSTPVITVEAGQPVAEAVRLLGENGIKRLPVMDAGRLVGILSEKDLRALTLPLKPLDDQMLREAQSVTAGEVMTPQPVTIGPDQPVEAAAVKLHDNHFGCLPVANEAGTLVGIITEDDVFEAMIAMTGARFPGVRISLEIEDKPGSIKEVTDVVRAEGGKIISIVTSYQGVRAGYRELILKISGDQAHHIVGRLSDAYPGTTVVRI
ncbi:MAG: CBS domain-containing protein [Acidobacteria bacterium]|nr:CBS domain-containing protein [Acidobacteriota bacterium]